MFLILSKMNKKTCVDFFLIEWFNGNKVNDFVWQGLFTIFTNDSQPGWYEHFDIMSNISNTQGCLTTFYCKVF